MSCYTNLKRISLALVSGLIFAACSPHIQAQSVDINVAALSSSGQVDAIVQRATPLIVKLRSLAVILLLGSVGITAIFATFGNIKYAQYILVASTILFGGFWVFATIRASQMEASPSLQSTTPNYASALDSQSAPATGEYAAIAIRPLIKMGINLLAAAAIPFILFYGLWLSVSYAVNAADAASIASYIIGAIIALISSTITAAFVSSFQ